LFLIGPDGETAEAEGAVVQGRRLEGSNNPNASNAVIYGKGTWIIHMLRRRMGDERFLTMLAELRRRYEGKPLDTDSFRLLCAQVWWGRSMTSARWLRARGAGRGGSGGWTTVL